VKPVAAAPNDDIVFMKVVDVAPPAGPWLSKRGQRGVRQHNEQQNQDHFFHCFYFR
jgi:hypothetical protein